MMKAEDPMIAAVRLKKRAQELSLIVPDSGNTLLN